MNFKNSFSVWTSGPGSNFWGLSQPHGMKLIFYLSHGMAVLDGNFWPKNLVASLAILHNTEVHMKKDFLKLVKRHAKQTPKTIVRIVQWGNFRIFLSFRFYVKSILENLEQFKNFVKVTVLLDKLIWRNIFLVSEWEKIYRFSTPVRF